MKKSIVLGIGALIASHVAAAEKADPRAVESCKAKSATFVQISECLPEAHVAFQVLDAFDKLYPPAAAPLKAKCIELNKDDISGAQSCVEAAIRSAIELGNSLPSGSSIPDPVFAAVNDPGLAEKLTAAKEKAQKAFPKHSVWGGNMYYGYK